jgi:hypothetical protein
MESEDKIAYTIYDIIRNEINMEPLICIHCKQVGEVTYYDYMGDAYCELCGKWQLDE